MIQRRWASRVFSHDGSCSEDPASVCLQLWINSLEARELVLVEGDTHSCGATNTGVGSLRGERAWGTRRRARSPWSQHACVSSDIWMRHLLALFTPQGKPEPTPPPPRLLREVRGQRRRPSSSPEAARELVGGQSARLPSKRFPTSPFRAHKHTTGSWPNNLISGSI